MGQTTRRASYQLKDSQRSEKINKVKICHNNQLRYGIGKTRSLSENGCVLEKECLDISK